jgi:hypothetical protein
MSNSLVVWHGEPFGEWCQSVKMMKKTTSAQLQTCAVGQVWTCVISIAADNGRDIVASLLVVLQSASFL